MTGTRTAVTAVTRAAKSRAVVMAFKRHMNPVTMGTETHLMAVIYVDLAPVVMAMYAKILTPPIPTLKSVMMGMTLTHLMAAISASCRAVEMGSINPVSLRGIQMSSA